MNPFHQRPNKARDDLDEYTTNLADYLTGALQHDLNNNDVLLALTLAMLAPKLAAIAATRGVIIARHPQEMCN